MSLADVKKNAQDRMAKSIETLRANLAKVRTGRAHAGILDSVMVEYYGSPTPLSQVANLTRAAGLPDIQQLPAAAWFLGQTVYLQASTMSYRDCFLVTAIVFAAALLPTWLLDRGAKAPVRSYS